MVVPFHLKAEGIIVSSVRHLQNASIWDMNK